MKGTRLLMVGLVAGCSLLEPARLELEPGASPVAFQVLGEEAILVDPALGQRELAQLGNFVAWSAKDTPRARLAVWDDEAAWKASHEDGTVVGESVLAHERGEYVKDPGPPRVEEFTVFGPDGNVLYERDFLDWPVSGPAE